MLNIFNFKVLDDLYDVRGEGFEVDYIKNFGKKEELEKPELAENELDEVVNSIDNEEKRKEIKSKISKFQDSMLGEMCFWDREYYKLGFLDGMNFKTELRNLKEKLSSKDNADITEMDSFFNNCLDDFLDYFERQKTERLSKRTEYIELRNKMQEIKNKYPNVRLYIEDEETDKNLNKEELMAVLEIIEIENNMNALEVEEAFKLGLKENQML